MWIRQVARDASPVHVSSHLRDAPVSRAGLEPTRLEQARGSRPSRRMLAAVARALRPTGDERDHLFHLAGEEPPRNRPTTEHVRPALLLVLDRMHVRLAALVRRLRARSEEFSALWDAHHVAVRRTDVKRFLHPVVGLMELDCEALLNPEHDQRLIVHTARPGSRSYERLELLRVIGLQNLTRG